jgi:hypothetical protein
MVKLPFTFNAEGYDFQSSLDVLRKSAQTGLNALNQEIAFIQLQLEHYLRLGKFEGERDEHGNVLWDRDDILEHKIVFARDAMMELRKAFAIICFHHWERSVQRWTAQRKTTTQPNNSYILKIKQDRGYKYLCQAAANIGYQPDTQLIRVCTLANMLKHNTDRLGTDLLKLWPDVFPPFFQKPPDLSDWASSVALTDQHLNEIFSIVSKSGPVARCYV